MSTGALSESTRESRERREKKVRRDDRGSGGGDRRDEKVRRDVRGSGDSKRREDQARRRPGRVSGENKRREEKVRQDGSKSKEDRKKKPRKDKKSKRHKEKKSSKDVDTASGKKRQEASPVVDEFGRRVQTEDDLRNIRERQRAERETLKAQIEARKQREAAAKARARETEMIHNQGGGGEGRGLNRDIRDDGEGTAGIIEVDEELRVLDAKHARELANEMQETPNTVSMPSHIPYSGSGSSSTDTDTDAGEGEGEGDGASAAMAGDIEELGGEPLDEDCTTMTSPHASPPTPSALCAFLGMDVIADEPLAAPAVTMTTHTAPAEPRQPQALDTEVDQPELADAVATTRGRLVIKLKKTTGVRPKTPFVPLTTSANQTEQDTTFARAMKALVGGDESTADVENQPEIAEGVGSFNPVAELQAEQVARKEDSQKNMAPGIDGADGREGKKEDDSSTFGGKLERKHERKGRTERSSKKRRRSRSRSRSRGKRRCRRRSRSRDRRKRKKRSKSPKKRSKRHSHGDKTRRVDKREGGADAGEGVARKRSRRSRSRETRSHRSENGKAGDKGDASGPVNDGQAASLDNDKRAAADAMSLEEEVALKQKLLANRQQDGHEVVGACVDEESLIQELVLRNHLMRKLSHPSTSLEGKDNNPSLIPPEEERLGADWCVSPALYTPSPEGSPAPRQYGEGEDDADAQEVMAERRRLREEADRENESDEEEQDMFGETFETDRNAPQPLVGSSESEDACDDADGFHKFRAGELLGSRYQVYSLAGKGVFSTAVRCRDLHSNGREVVVKVIRRNDMMARASLHEEKVLQQLEEQDTSHRGHCVRMHCSFEHKGHRCLVFDAYECTMRKVIRSQWGTGVSLQAVKAYGTQLLLALRLLGKCGIVHADIKPDNMLTQGNTAHVVLSDFGSAVNVRGQEGIAPYLASRYYRAPEVILGRPFGHATDMWAVGCVLFELYTGQYLFAGRDNNHMLKLHMEGLGMFPRRILRSALFAGHHFDADWVFRYREPNKALGNITERKIHITSATNPVKDRVVKAAKGTRESDNPALRDFIDILERMLALDPEKRITVKAAMGHPFISGAGR